MLKYNIQKPPKAMACFGGIAFGGQPIICAKKA